MHKSAGAFRFKKVQMKYSHIILFITGRLFYRKLLLVCPILIKYKNIVL
jgi:hypothetical protein